MSSRKIFVMSLATLLLAGCKTTVETEVSLNDLLTGGSKAIPSSLYVEVAACQDYQDSRQPSSSLLEVQQQISGIFKDAEYVECFRKKMDSYAHFKMPIYLDKDADGKLASNDHLNLLSNDKDLLSVAVPESVQKKLSAAQKKMMGPALEMNVSIKVNNDTGADFNFSAIAAFVNGQPQVFGNLTSNAGKAFTVALSDVSVQAAMTGDGARVLLHRN